MDCENIRALLWQAGSYDADAADAREVGNHLKTCPACSREMEALQKLQSLLPETAPKKSEAYWENYTQNTLRRIEEDVARKTFISPWRLAPAMALVLVLLVWTVSKRIEQEKKQSEILANLELLENMDLLEHEDFNDIVKEVQP